MLDTGLGTPKHPLFLFGKKYRNADRNPPQAAAAKSHSVSLQSWYQSRKAARQPSIAAVQPPRDSANMQKSQQRLRMLPQSASCSPSFTASPSSLHDRPPAEELSLQPAVSNGKSAAQASANTKASMQSGAEVTDPKWGSRQHPYPTRTPLSMAGPPLGLPIADPHADPAASAHFSSSLAESAVDLEAQDGSCLASHAPNSTAGMRAAASALGPQHIGNGSECGGATDEPADVAAERAKADRLWAATDAHSGGSTYGDRNSGEFASPSGPAILLHKLRKVCKAAHRYTDSSMLAMIVC